MEKLAEGKWHHLSTEDVISKLETSPENGLTSDEAANRLKTFGPNKLPEVKKKNAILRFLAHFHNVLIYVLIVAAIITALMDHWIDTWVIIAVVFINALIGFVQEGKAEKALEGIKKMLTLKAHVIRDGKRLEIDAEELVPGDVVRLESGDKVPADVRIISDRNLKIEESALTGESDSVTKTTKPSDENAVIGDRKSMAFNSTMVTYGRGIGVVTSTGANTEIGKISTMMSKVERITTPLLRQIDQFGKYLSVAIVGLTGTFFLFGYLFRDYSMEELFMAVIGLAVAAIPEGLPAIMTITLAIGVQRMAGRNAIIRNLPSVETLGSVTVICSDKTGTLTKNEMTAKTVITASGRFHVEGTGYKPKGGFLLDDKKITPSDHPDLFKAIKAVSLCNDADLAENKDGRWEIKGDPTEGALVTLGRKAGYDTSEYKRVDAIPFESDHKFMATLHRNASGDQFIFLKGAPERVIEMCAEQLNGDKTESMKPDFWHKSIEEVAENGQRVIAAAIKKVDGDVKGIDMEDVESGMLFLGLVGMIDPPRPEAIESIRQCLEAGIKVKMITGDHAITAKSIGLELGIGDGKKAITGSELEKINDDDLIKTANEYDVFARTTPEHKLRLVRALQTSGEIVAMTGDGVNDAPALKRADVGVAMGIKGTEVSRDASDMVLADDNFASIANAVEEGRTIYDNLRKTLLFILPTNGAEACVLMVAILLGMALPITPVQILWVNMITAVTLALALAFEPTEPGVMKRNPRDPKTPILGMYFIWRIAFVSLLISGFTLLMYHYFKTSGYPLEQARTIAINILVAGQAFYLFNCRYMRENIFSKGFFTNKVVFISIAVLIVFQVLFTYAPFMNLWFGTEPIVFSYWGWVIASGIGVFLIVEVEKMIFRKVRRV